jgi:hypothetical protein
METEIKINAPEGFEIDKENSTFELNAFIVNIENYYKKFYSKHP